MVMKTLPYKDRIVRDPQILVGKPAVKGTRIPVDLVLAYLARNPNFDALFADYPRLTLDDVKACLAYARRNAKATPEVPLMEFPVLAPYSYSFSPARLTGPPSSQRTQGKRPVSSNKWKLGERR